MAVDIVCGREVDPAQVNATVGHIPAGAPETDPGKGTKSFHKGAWYYFCSMACRNRFMTAPEEFLAKQA